MPLVDLLPLQPPLAVHVGVGDALDALLQESVADDPAVIVEGEILSVKLGATVLLLGVGVLVLGVVVVGVVVAFCVVGAVGAGWLAAG